MIARQVVGAYITRLHAVRAALVSTATRRWDAIDTHNDAASVAFGAAIVPVVVAAQTTAVRATQAYLRMMSMTLTGSDPGIELDPTDFVGDAARGGVAVSDVYQRPFGTFWAALAAGDDPTHALDTARTRLQQTAETDVTIVARNSAGAGMQSDGRIVGWRRVLSGGSSCEVCTEAAQGFYRSDQLMDIHQGCACGVEPVYASDREPTDTGAVAEHGELGPVTYQPADPGAAAEE